MSTVIITMLTGPHAGRSAKFESGPVTFGRSPDNMVVLATESASRQHGQLECRDENKWVLVNNSKNFTTLNGRKVKTEKPMKEGDQVGIGGEKFFSVSFEAQPAAAAPAAAPEPAPQEAQPAANLMGASTVTMETKTSELNPDQAQAASIARKKKLWIGLGVWIFLVFGFIIISQAFMGGEATIDSNAKYISPDEIKAIVTSKLNTDNLVPDEEKMEEHKLIAMRNIDDFSNPAALYLAYKNFRLAKFHNRDQPLDPKSELHMAETEKKLVDAIQSQYQSALLSYRSNIDNDAKARFIELRKMYPDENSKINKVASEHIKIIIKRNAKGD